MTLRLIVLLQNKDIIDVFSKMIEYNEFHNIYYNMEYKNDNIITF
jgi:hypothetical protein